MTTPSLFGNRNSPNVLLFLLPSLLEYVYHSSLGDVGQLLVQDLGDAPLGVVSGRERPERGREKKKFEFLLYLGKESDFEQLNRYWKVSKEISISSACYWTTDGQVIREKKTIFRGRIAKFCVKSKFTAHRNVLLTCKTAALSRPWP